MGECTVPLVPAAVGPDDLPVLGKHQGYVGPTDPPPTARSGRVDELWRYIGQRCEDEPSLPHPRMRHDQIGFVEADVAHEQHVDIERPGAPVFMADPMRVLLEALGESRGAPAR